MLGIKDTAVKKEGNVLPEACIPERGRQASNELMINYIVIMTMVLW